jgi:hypothetical protein
MDVHSEAKRKHVHQPKSQPPSQHKVVILPKSTKKDLRGKVDGKILDDTHTVGDYVKIG